MRIYQIAVLGSHRENLPKYVLELAEQVGKEVAQRGHILVTGCSTRVSRHAVKGAKSKKGLVLGVSPYNKRRESSSISTGNIDVLVCSGLGFKGRNVLSVQSSDGLIIINGGFGTLNEVTIAGAENKPIVVIEKTGGCADQIRSILQKLSLKYTNISYSKDPVAALDNLIGLIEK